MSYDSSVLAYKPLAYWKLDDLGDEAPTVVDSSGNNANGMDGAGSETREITGCLTEPNGGGAMSFNGITGYLTLGNISKFFEILSSSSGVQLDLFVKTTQATVGGLFEYKNAGTSRVRVVLNSANGTTTSDGKIFIELRDASGATANVVFDLGTSPSPPYYRDGRWRKLSVELRAIPGQTPEIRLYVSGNRINQVSSSSLSPLGAFQDGSNIGSLFFVGTSFLAATAQRVVIWPQWFTEAQRIGVYKAGPYSFAGIAHVSVHLPFRSQSHVWKRSAVGPGSMINGDKYGRVFCAAGSTYYATDEVGQGYLGGASNLPVWTSRGALFNNKLGSGDAFHIGMAFSTGASPIAFSQTRSTMLAFGHFGGAYTSQSENVGVFALGNGATDWHWSLAMGKGTAGGTTNIDERPMGVWQQSFRDPVISPGQGSAPSPDNRPLAPAVPILPSPGLIGHTGGRHGRVLGQDGTFTMPAGTIDAGSPSSDAHFIVDEFYAPLPTAAESASSTLSGGAPSNLSNANGRIGSLGSAGDYNVFYGYLNDLVVLDRPLTVTEQQSAASYQKGQFTRGSRVTFTLLADSKTSYVGSTLLDGWQALLPQWLTSKSVFRAGNRGGRQMQHVSPSLAARKWLSHSSGQTGQPVFVIFLGNNDVTDTLGNRTAAQIKADLNTITNAILANNPSALFIVATIAAHTVINNPDGLTQANAYNADLIAGTGISNFSKITVWQLPAYSTTSPGDGVHPNDTANGYPLIASSFASLISETPSLQQFLSSSGASLLLY